MLRNAACSRFLAVMKRTWLLQWLHMLTPVPWVLHCWQIAPVTCCTHAQHTAVFLAMFVQADHVPLIRQVEADISAPHTPTQAVCAGLLSCLGCAARSQGVAAETVSVSARPFTSQSDRAMHVLADRQPHWQGCKRGAAFAGCVVLHAAAMRHVTITSMRDMLNLEGTGTSKKFLCAICSIWKEQAPAEFLA